MNYSESQKFNIKWINWVLVLILIVLITILIYATIQKIKNAPLIMSAGIILVSLIIVVFNTSKLKTNFLKTEIIYSFFPFTLKEHKIYVKDIENIAIKNIDPLSDFGGYGLRIKNNTVAYILSSKVIEIFLKNKKKIIFSIANSENIELYIEDFLKSKQQ